MADRGVQKSTETKQSRNNRLGNGCASPGARYQGLGCAAPDFTSEIHSLVGLFVQMEKDRARLLRRREERGAPTFNNVLNGALSFSHFVFL
jgi:hypothetical protein